MAGTVEAADVIYHWIDGNGIPNFSQQPPDEKIQGVSTLYLADTIPPDYDPEDDRYGVQAQAERMSALRREMEQRREAARERERTTAVQPVQYREPYRGYSYGAWFPLVYSRPPHKPEPSIEAPYPTSSLKPPGQ
jgi:hypothetical protein